MKYSDALAECLKEAGYTTVFFVSGGNIMHLIESFSSRFKMIPVLHEVSAVLATDYFNETSPSDKEKALALVTLGPGVTNTVSGIASAFVDSREVLLIGGQVKSTDMKTDRDRQNGLQEIHGEPLMRSITKKSVVMKDMLHLSEFHEIISHSWLGRKGPVYVEICLDVQGRTYTHPIEATRRPVKTEHSPENTEEDENAILEIVQRLASARRPIILVGGGFARELSPLLQKFSLEFGIPVATSWNGADRFSADSIYYAGRPNMFGQRWANIFIQQADFILVLGSSLGIQQTGFNVAEFAKNAVIAQIDIDPQSLLNPELVNLKGFQGDVNSWFPKMYSSGSNVDWHLHVNSRKEWLAFLAELRTEFPVVEEATKLHDKTNPFQVIYDLSLVASRDTSIVSCSSGGTYTSFMQTFQNKSGQVVISSKGMGSMGVGLAGAIGVTCARNNEVWLFEGDGGFAQNLQELGTVAANNLNLKIFVFSNHGYSSIRSTQKRYFNGNYVGCDLETGLGLPNLRKIAEAFNISYLEIPQGQFNLSEVLNEISPTRALLIEIFLDVDQTYLPKIDSRVLPNGGMESNPLHIMSPEISDAQSELYFRYI